MTLDYRIRVLGARGCPETLDLEISPITGPTKRVFIVLDLSDSCQNALKSLSKLAWLWQLLPPQWLVSFYALSGREVLYPSGGSLHARDLESCIRDLEGSPEAEQWVASHIQRGSFIHYPLTGIEEAWRAEREIHQDPTQEALVFVLTDGELLDLAPLTLPAGMTVVGVLTNSENDGLSCWSKVLPKSKAYPQRATELLDHVRQLIAPGKQPCEVVPSFDCTLRDEPLNTGSRRLKPLSFKWDFGKGPLVLSAATSILEDSNAYIECRPKKGRPVRMSLDRLPKDGLGTQAAQAMALPSATLSNGQLVRIDDPLLGTQILDHLKTQSGRGKGIEEALASHLRTLLASKRSKAKTPRPDAGQGYEAAIVIAVPLPAGGNRDVSSVAVPTVLVVGGLLKDEKYQLFIQHADTVPHDPGFTAKQTLRVVYDLESARWHLFIGTEKKTLAPRASEALDDLFIDADGHVCEAFYTGPLVPRTTGGM